MTTASSLHALDYRLVSEILQFAEDEFGRDLEEETDVLETHPGMSPQFAVPWIAYVSDFYRRPLVDWFLTAHGRSLKRDERKWLEAQRNGWLSIWEVVAVERGRSIDLRDMLTNEERHVQEVSASKLVDLHQLVLTRVVDADSISLICGMHPLALDPLEGAVVIESVRKLLRRKTAVTPDRLRDPKVAWRMLLGWSDAIARRRTPPRLQNKDVTDEELLQVLGLDPELQGPERNALVTMARNQLALEERVEQLTTVETGRAVENSWAKQLDDLEASYGAIPGTREQQLRFAAEEGIVSPADLYFKLSAPVKKEVEGLASAARREAEKRVQSGGLRPRSSAAAPAPVKAGMSMRDAVKAAAKSAEKETGLSWKQAVKRVLTSTPGDEKQ